MKLRVTVIVDGMAQIADHTFDVDSPHLVVTVNDSWGNGKPKPPEVLVRTGHGSIAAHVELIP